MKNVVKSLRRISTGILVIVSTGVILAACNKSDKYNIDLPAAGLMVFNLAPDQPAVGVALSGNSINPSPLSFRAYTGQYINIYPGTRAVETYDFISNYGFAASSFTFEPEKYYSLFVVGADSVYRNLLVTDNFDNLSASGGKAYIRYVNAIPDSSRPIVSIRTGAVEVVKENTSFADVSPFIAVDPGALAIEIKNGESLNATRSIDVIAKRVYTILFSGKPGELNNDKAVQIRFIQNGILTDSTTKD
ncbi:MAG: DUF4397 domain-containing protein [Chitinophagaceae bacterium]|nr:MAG: DUF4397 domain-containing protein [Chitinophagaceae bacterium]